MISAVGRYSETKLGKETYVTSNDRAIFSQSYDISGIIYALSYKNMNLKPIFPLLFFEHGYLADIIVTEIQFSTEVNNIHMLGTVSQNLFLSLSSYFI